MRSCPTCGLNFDDGRLVCASDGDILFDLGKPVAETGRVLGGRYRLGNLLGEGGMGRVFEALRLDLPETVALKLLRGDSGPGHELAEKRFRVEAEAAAALDHPGVVKVHEFSRTPEGLSYIVMERLRGATFQELRLSGKFANPERVVELLREVCEVLEAAHRRGIVHRDLKPQNLFLHRIDRDRSQVKVLDFGIAKVLERPGERLTSTGELLGTLLYMAPEQIEGQPVTPAMDVYSLGVVLFEALSGRVPFKGRSPLELARLHASTPAPALSTFQPEISEELDAVVARALLKRPESRYRHAGALAGALRGVRAVGSSGPPGETRALWSNASFWVGLVLDERYEIQEWIAPGRFGSDVYRALHLRAGAQVAVRLWRTRKGAVRDLLLEAFRKEARSMGVLHPNLIGILDLGFNEHCLYLVTALVESISLRTLLVREGPLPAPVAVDLAKGAMDGLRALHEKGIVSGGLSPETLRVTGGRDGPRKLLLTPFGLVNHRQLHSLLEEPVPGARDPALEYISPEQREGAEPDPRSDLYSLARILLEMLGGQEGLDPKWKEFFGRALAAEPARRFATAAEWMAALPE